MTRINTVHPTMLAKRQLFAEYRELPRIFNLVRKRIDKGHSPADVKIPTDYRMGTGHVLFFYDKLKYLSQRQTMLVQECLNRNIDISHTDTDDLLEGIPKEWCNDWKPTSRDHDINISRLVERKGLI